MNNQDLILRINEFTLNQDKKYGYEKLALESINGGDGAIKGKLVELLYKDVLSKSNIDFGDIPASKGDITKYQLWQNIENCLSALNKLLANQKVEPLTLANDLKNMIVSERQTFANGYKYDIEFIKVTYCTLVLSLMELINICILAYADYLKDVKQIEFKRLSKGGEQLVVKNVRSIVKSYKKGEWSQAMAPFIKVTKSNLALESISSDYIATEMSLGSLKTLVKFGTKAIKILAKVLPIITSSTFVIVCTIAVFASIRQLIYYFYCGTSKIADYSKNYSAFLAEVTAEGGLDPKAEKRISRASGFFNTIANVIETKILKTNSDAQKAIAKADKDIYSASELQKPIDVSTSDEAQTVDSDVSAELNKMASQGITF